MVLIITLKMTIVKFQNKLGYYGHNGRHYNFIFTYDPNTNEFKCSAPFFNVTWIKGQPIPPEVLKEAKKTELTLINKFITNPDTYCN